MFNRTLEMRVVKPAKHITDAPQAEPFMTKDEITTLAQKTIKNTAFAIIAVMTAAAVLTTASEIIVRATEPKNAKK